MKSISRRGFVNKWYVDLFYYPILNLAIDLYPDKLAENQQKILTAAANAIVR